MPASGVNPPALKKDTRPHGQGTKGQGRKETQKEEEKRWRSQEKMMEEELARSGACWGYTGRDEDGEIGKNNELGEGEPIMSPICREHCR